MTHWKTFLTALLLLLTAGCTPVGDDTRTLTVMLPDSAGLFVGNDVGVLGITIGTVTELTPDGTIVRATIEITDPDIKLPADVGAAIVPRSIAADRYLELTPVYDHGPTLADGATVPVERTVTPVDFDRMLGSVKRLTEDLTSSPEATANLGEFLDAADGSLGGRGDDLNRATRSIASAVSEVNSQRGTIIGTVESLTTLTRTLNANETTVRQFIEDMAAAAELLSDERLNIGASLSSLSASINDVARLARQNRTALSTDIRALTKVLRNTDASQEDIEGILDALPLASQNIQRATTDNGRLRVQLDPLALTPLGPFVEKLCTRLGPLCNLVGLGDPGAALDPTLAALLGGS